mmetsp:Transcript_9416/g.39978  ORF Transcript_9416/g.39978 Transcript_9416/m.39978 type:complete len:273 (-) Transcript_9416:298-1116(-)
MRRCARWGHRDREFAVSRVRPSDASGEALDRGAHVIAALQGRGHRAFDGVSLPAPRCFRAPHVTRGGVRAVSRFTRVASLERLAAVRRPGRGGGRGRGDHRGRDARAREKNGRTGRAFDVRLDAVRFFGRRLDPSRTRRCGFKTRAGSRVERRRASQSDFAGPQRHGRERCEKRRARRAARRRRRLGVALHAGADALRHRAQAAQSVVAFPGTRFIHPEADQTTTRQGARGRRRRAPGGGAREQTRASAREDAREGAQPRPGQSARGDAHRF